MLVLYAGFCENVHFLRGNNKRCDNLRADSLRVQFWAVFGKHLDKNFAGKRRYENANDCADNRCCHQYYSWPAVDFWYVWSAENGNCRRCDSHRCGADCCSFGGDEKGAAQAPLYPPVSKAHSRNIPAWHSQYPYAVGIHVLHIRVKSDSGDLFRRSGHSTWALL